MNVSKINGLLGQVRIRLESLDPNAAEEGIEHMSPGSSKSIKGANDRVGFLMSKLTTGRNKANKVRATGTSKSR